MAKNQINLKKSLVIVTFTLLIAGILLSAIPTASANGVISVQPNQGKPGTLINVNGGGFSGRVFISFNGTGVGNGMLPNSMGSIQGSFAVPNVAAGTYNITASDNNGVTPAVIFTVLDSNASPSPSSSPSSHTATPHPSSTHTVAPTDSGSSTTATPHSTRRSTVAANSENGFFSPLVIGIIAVVAVIVVVLLLIFMLRARGGGRRRDDLLRREEPPAYRPPPTPTPPTPPSTPASSPFATTSASRPYVTAAERYGRPTTYRPPTYGQQSTGSTITSRPTPSYSQQPTSGTKTCPNCKRAVRADYSVCPYCYKRMK